MKIKIIKINLIKVSLGGVSATACLTCFRSLPFNLNEIQDTEFTREYVRNNGVRLLVKVQAYYLFRSLCHGKETAGVATLFLNVRNLTENRVVEVYLCLMSIIFGITCEGLLKNYFSSGLHHNLQALLSGLTEISLINTKTSKQ